jgi:hypothetical protein
LGKERSILLGEQPKRQRTNHRRCHRNRSTLLGAGGAGAEVCGSKGTRVMIHDWNVWNVGSFDEDVMHVLAGYARMRMFDHCSPGEFDGLDGLGNYFKQDEIKRREKLDEEEP